MCPNLNESICLPSSKFGQSEVIYFFNSNSCNLIRISLLPR